MTPPIRVAVVGAGMAGIAYAVALGAAAAALDGADASEVDRVAIVSSDPERGEGLRRRAGFERYVPGVGDLLDLNLDGVILAGTNDAHADAAVALLDRGIGVLCEKPLAGSLDDARRVVAAARDSEAPALVGFSYRWAPAAESIRQLVTGGGIGDVVHIRGRYWADYGGDPFAPGAWRHRGAPPECVLSDVGSHIVDFAEFLTGAHLVEIRGGMLRTVTAERPDGSGGTMRVADSHCHRWASTTPAFLLWAGAEGHR